MLGICFFCVEGRLDVKVKGPAAILLTLRISDKENFPRETQRFGSTAQHEQTSHIFMATQVPGEGWWSSCAFLPPRLLRVVVLLFCCSSVVLIAAENMLLFSLLFLCRCSPSPSLCLSVTSQSQLLVSSHSFAVSVHFSYRSTAVHQAAAILTALQSFSSWCVTTLWCFYGLQKSRFSSG